MRKTAAIIVIGLAGLLMGMGDLGGRAAGTVPETAENVKVRVVDRQGVVTELSQFSMDGNLHIEGRRGSGVLSIPFANLQAIEFGASNGEELPATLHLISGENLQMQIRRRTIFFGSTGFGAFQIVARDIKRIEFLSTR